MTIRASRKKIEEITGRIRACRLCAETPEGAILPHEPRPVLRVSSSARLLLASQAPGNLVNQTGVPFNDPSGDRLRDWMGVDRETFYDVSRIAIVPMGLCYPGTDCSDCEGGVVIVGDGCENSCEFAYDGFCDDGRPGAASDFCFPGSDCCDCDGVCDRFDCDDSCEFSGDGECDDVKFGGTGFCPDGTDCFDCSGFDDNGGGGFDCDDSCDFSGDGECDDGRPGAVSNFCFPGSDCCDCDGLCGGGFACDDNCELAFDGFCDDESFGGSCLFGTDCTDCGVLDDGFKRAAHKRSVAKHGVAHKRSAAKHGVAKRDPSVKRYASKNKAATWTTNGKVKGRAKSDLYFPVPSQRVPLTSPVHYRVDWRTAKQHAGAEKH